MMTQLCVLSYPLASSSDETGALGGFMKSSQRGSGVTSGGSTSTQIRDPYKFTFRRTGGFAPMEDKLIVDSAAKRLTVMTRNAPPRTVQASPKDLRELEERLEAADFLHTKRSFRCEGCGDQRIYDATLSMGGASAAVHWETLSEAPAELFALSVLGDRLLDENLGPWQSTGSGGRSMGQTAPSMPQGGSSAHQQGAASGPQQGAVWAQPGADSGQQQGAQEGAVWAQPGADSGPQEGAVWAQPGAASGQQGASFTQSKKPEQQLSHLVAELSKSTGVAEADVEKVMEVLGLSRALHSIQGSQLGTHWLTPDALRIALLLGPVVVVS